MTRQSEAINELAAALAKAQAVMGGAVKDAANPFFKSRYADLASVLDACRKPLSDNGLCVIQSPSAQDAAVSVETILAHASGQFVAGVLTATAKDGSPQSVGSAITYLRRYALQAIAGVAPEDDDGEAAQGRPGATQTAKPPVSSPPPVTPDGMLTDGEQARVLAAAKAAGITTTKPLQQALFNICGVNVVAAIPRKELKNVLEAFAAMTVVA